MNVHFYSNLLHLYKFRNSSPSLLRLCWCERHEVQREGKPLAPQAFLPCDSERRNAEADF